MKKRKGIARRSKEVAMLAISLEPDEYITINGDIVVKVSKIAKGRCFLAIEADRSIPIVRSAVLERNGTPPPACIIPNPKKHHKPD
jgi:preprotein translocase subunit YajC